MAILMAFRAPSVEIIGLTTIFGNVSTEGATRHPEVPVAEGSPEPLKGGKPRLADFVHGSDGIGNMFLPEPATKKVEESAAEFLAIKRDSSFASKVKKIVVLGGAFFAAGNVNPAAEANILGDPEAADIVFTSGADIVVVGINITTQDLLELRNSKGKHAQFLSEMCKFYRDWHAKSDGFYGIFLHDPVSFTALVHPEYFTFKKGVMEFREPMVRL
nr:unnamed protein product [Digitaria exilis]